MIGLLTFHRANNYGAVLQAYALQNVVEGLGYECEYLDISFNPGQIQETEKQNTMLRKLSKLKNIKGIIRGRKRTASFQKFRKLYLKISEEKFGSDKYITDSSKYESYIVGSDQVWNLNITNSTLSFLLHFVDKNKKKNSYASSFGVETLNEKEKEIFKKYLSRFDNISVREKQGANIISSLIGKEATVCLDPTMLIDKEHWSAMAGRIRYRKYVLIYAMADSAGLIKKAKEIAQKKKLKIIAIGLKNEVKGIKNIRTASPTQWLGLIKNADTVVTNSFHGTAFSLNFNKNFYVEYLPTGWSVNSRLKNIIEMFGLEECLIDEETICDSASINYNNVNKILNEKRVKSLNYLRSIL